MNSLCYLVLGLTWVRETTLFLLASGINNDYNQSFSSQDKVYIDNINLQKRNHPLYTPHPNLQLFPTVDIIMSDPQDMNPSSLQQQSSTAFSEVTQDHVSRQSTYAQLHREDSLNSPLQTISIPSQALQEHTHHNSQIWSSQLNPILEGENSKDLPCSLEQQIQVLPVQTQNQAFVEGNDNQNKNVNGDASLLQKQTNSKGQQINNDATQKVVQFGEEQNCSEVRGQQEICLVPERASQTHEIPQQTPKNQNVIHDSLLEQHYQQIPTEELAQDDICTQGKGKKQPQEEHFFYGVEYQGFEEEKQNIIEQNDQKEPHNNEQLLPTPQPQHKENDIIQEGSGRIAIVQSADQRPNQKDKVISLSQAIGHNQEGDHHPQEFSILNIHTKKCTVVIQSETPNQPQDVSNSNIQPQTKQQMMSQPLNVELTNRQSQELLETSINAQSISVATIIKQTKQLETNQKEKQQKPNKTYKKVDEVKEQARQNIKQIGQNPLTKSQTVPEQQRIEEKRSNNNLKTTEEIRLVDRASEIAPPASQIQIKQQQQDKIHKVQKIQDLTPRQQTPLQAIPHSQANSIPIHKFNQQMPDEQQEVTIERMIIRQKPKGKKKKKSKPHNKPVEESEKKQMTNTSTIPEIQAQKQSLPPKTNKYNYKNMPNNPNPTKRQPKTQDQLNPSSNLSIPEIKSQEQPPLTSQTIENQAYKERMGSTYNVFLKYVSNYTRAINFYKSIVENVCFEINYRKVQRNNLQALLTQYFQGYAKLNQEFQLKTQSIQYDAVPASSNSYCNIKFELRNGYNALLDLRNNVANEKNKINSFILGTVIRDIKQAFSVYFGKISLEQTKQTQRKAEHLCRQKAFFKVISQVQKVFKKGIKGKFKIDILSELARFVNDETTHRQFLKIYGKGVIPLRHTYIQAECELFNSLQHILNAFKTESKVLYSVGRKFFQLIEDVSRKVKEQTKFQQISPLTDIDYIRYVLQLQEKKDHRVFKSHHFQSYLDLIFFDKLVGNIRDLYKGAICKIFPMSLPHEQLVHSVSGNLVHFNRETDQCLNVFVIKNINARIIDQCTVQFDQLIKGFIFDENRTVRIKLKDSDRTEELICYLNEKEEDYEVEEGLSRAT